MIRKLMTDDIGQITRIIPTRVGNTLILQQWPQRAPDHPHACGEHLCFSAAIQVSSGSSPRVWGTPCIAIFAICALRIIPTRVGNTSRQGGKSYGEV